jgi:hypothetical protein
MFQEEDGAMRTKILCLLSVLGLLVGLSATSFARPINQYDQMIDDYLKDVMEAKHYYLAPVKNQFAARALPNFDFCGVYFQQYPVAYLPPEDLAESNVFFVNKTTEDVQYLTGPDDLLNFFRLFWDPIVGPSGSENFLKDGAKTWLRLSQEFSQDGFYQFSKPMVMVEGETAFGMVTVEQGGTGFLAVIMNIGPLGELSVVEERHIHPGERPLLKNVSDGD